jgi:tetratricopeptide (TPR) repeat protein
LLEEFARWHREEYGDRNRYTVLVLRQLAGALTEGGKYDRAADLYRELIAGSGEEKVSLLWDLMAVYQKAGRFDQEFATGETILEQVRSSSGKNISPWGHQVRLTLARRCKEVGKPELAERMIEGDLQESRKDNGPDHPATLALMPFVAERYFAADQPDKALAFLAEAVDRRRKGQGADHLDTVLAEYSLAEGQRQAGKVEEAIKTYAAVLPKMKEKLGAQDPRIPAALMAAAEVYESAGKAADAEPLRRDNLEIQRKAMPYPEAPPVTLALALLGLNLLKQEKWVEAEKTLRECLELRRKHEAQLWSTYNVMSLVGASLAGQKKFKEAEPLLREGYQGMKEREASIPPQARVRLTEALQRLVKLYEDTDRRDRADEYRKQLPPATGQ